MRRVSKRVNKSRRRVSKRIQKSRRISRRKDRQDRQDKNRKTRKQMKRSKTNNKTNRQTGKRRNRRNKKNKKRNKKNYNNKQRGGGYHLTDVTEEIKKMITDKTPLPKQTYVVYKENERTEQHGIYFGKNEKIPWDEYVFIKEDGSELILHLTKPMYLGRELEKCEFKRYYYEGSDDVVPRLADKIVIDNLLCGAVRNYTLLGPEIYDDPFDIYEDESLKDMYNHGRAVVMPGTTFYVGSDELTWDVPQDMVIKAGYEADWSFL